MQNQVCEKPLCRMRDKGKALLFRKCDNKYNCPCAGKDQYAVCRSCHDVIHYVSSVQKFIVLPRPPHDIPFNRWSRNLTAVLDEYYPDFQDKRKFVLSGLSESDRSTLKEIQEYLSGKEEKERELLHAVLFQQCMIQQGIDNVKNIPPNFIYSSI